MERVQAGMKEGSSEEEGSEGLQGGGWQMEIDGGRDEKIKRNMPLGVTEEGVRVMRGLQA